MDTEFLDTPTTKLPPQELVQHATPPKPPPTAEAEVSTGKPETTTPATILVKEGKRPTIVFDPREATFEYPFFIPDTQSYVVRARELITAQGWTVTNKLREALELRQGLAFDSGPLPAQSLDFQMAVSAREADILLRSGANLKSEFLLKALKEPGCFLTEEGSRLEKVFVLRARYNKGIEWQNTKRAYCDETTKLNGDQRLYEIAAMLEKLDFPLHQEEKAIGFHLEFLKPEWLTWPQFQTRINYLQKYRTVAEKEDMQALINLTTLKS